MHPFRQVYQVQWSFMTMLVVQKLFYSPAAYFCVKGDNATFEFVSDSRSMAHAIFPELIHVLKS